jgi:hypothetical protein
MLDKRESIIKLESDMNKEEQRDFGPQPIAEIMQQKELKSHDLVAASTEQITHKMVTRACKGRKLTPNVKTKIQKALNLATNHEYKQDELFNY